MMSIGVQRTFHVSLKELKAPLCTPSIRLEALCKTVTEKGQTTENGNSNEKQEKADTHTHTHSSSIHTQKRIPSTRQWGKDERTKKRERTPRTKSVISDSESEDDAPLLTRKYLWNRLLRQGCTQRALLLLEEQYSKLIAKPEVQRAFKSLADSQHRNWILCAALPMEERATFVETLCEESGLKARTVATYWRCYMAAAKALQIDIGPFAAKFRKHLESKFEALDNMALTLDQARRVAEILRKKRLHRTLLVFRLTWLLAQRAADVLRIRDVELYSLVGRFLAIRITEGKTTARLGPFPLFLPLTTQLAQSIIKLKQTRTTQGMLFGDVATRAMELSTALKQVAKEDGTTLHQRAIRRGAAQRISALGLADIVTMKRVLRHAPEHRTTEGYMHNGLTDLRWAMTSAELASVNGLDEEEAHSLRQCAHMQPPHDWTGTIVTKF